MATLGPLAAYLQTPRTDTGRLQVSVLQELAAGALAAGASSIAVLGSVGGAAYLPVSMRKRVIAAVAEVVDGTVPLIAGVGAITTAEVEVNITTARDAGATVALLAPHSYEPLTGPEVLGLYREVAARHVLPVVAYHNPRTTRHRFSVAQLGELARMPGVVGFKDVAVAPHLIEPRLAATQQGLTHKQIKALDWGFSGEGYGAQILMSGADTWHSALAGILPGPCAQMAHLAVQSTRPRALGQAERLSAALTPIAVIAKNYGSIRVTHAIAQQLGIKIGSLPSPLRPLEGEVMGLLAAALGAIDTQVMPVPSSRRASRTGELGEQSQSYRPRRAAQSH